LLELYNSLTRKLEPFESLERGTVKMFTCGPSIYQRPHIGNYRTYLFEDVLQRYLEYQGYQVTRVLNFTDVEEKAILEAKKRGMDLLELTEQCGRVFFNELQVLHIKLPTYNPKSSTSVDEAVHLIQELLKKGHAYWYKGNVYFDPLTFEGFGKLAHLDMSRWPRVKKRFHRDTYSGNRWNMGDFILWHGYNKGDTVYWETALGRGRPAWNVQDPAMALQTLGSSIDIYCGGEDNLVRHHDYTIAVAESVTGKPLARFWLHGAHLLVGGKKMSKSKGNVIYIDELLKAGYTSEDIRFFLIYSHYRKRLNFTYDKLARIAEKLNQAREMIDSIHHAGAGVQASDGAVKELSERLKHDFEKKMDNDLQVKEAFDELFRTLLILTRLAGKKKVTSEDAQHIITTLKSIDRVLQVFPIL
jgi:cysteinyl-tRNA synthetase